LIYELKSNDSRRKTLTEFDINLFQFDKDDRIVDLKMFTNEEGMILILAITKMMLFQFVGKKEFGNVFENYNVDKGDVIKAVKRFFKKSKRNEIINKIKSGKKMK